MAMTLNVQSVICIFYIVTKSAVKDYSKPHRHFLTVLIRHLITMMKMDEGTLVEAI